MKYEEAVKNWDEWNGLRKKYLEDSRIDVEYRDYREPDVEAGILLENIAGCGTRMIWIPLDANLIEWVMRNIGSFMESKRGVPDEDSV